MEIIKSHTINNSPVYISILDFRKASICVNHFILFDKLIERNIPSKLVKLIQNWNINQEVFVNCKNCNSKSWYLRNGVRHGVVLS